MKAIYKHFYLTLCTILAFAMGACTEEVDYTPAEGIDGQGVFFPTSTITSYELDGVSGSITLDAQRTKSEGALDAELTASFTAGGESLFTVPSTVSFAAGETATQFTVSFDKLIRGTEYEVTLKFTDGTPYSNSTIKLSFLYPNVVEYTWETVSENACFIDYMFSMYGAPEMAFNNIVVEKAVGYDLYRFQSIYTNEYFQEVFEETGNVFPVGYEYPYIVLDGETYKEYGDYWYIAPTNLAFQMVNGEGYKFDEEWNTFGSVACNLSAGGEPIPPTSTSYPLGSYDKKSMMFDLGSVYHNLGGYGFYVVKKGSFLLYLDARLMEPDYDRDYTWYDVPEATGFFTSQLTGESWMQGVQQAEEDSTFYRLTSPYADGYHLYFNYDDVKGTVTMPKGQKSGLTTFGNEVFMEAVPGKSSFDTETNTLALVVSFYIADKDGNKVAELQQVTETLLWGQSELGQLQRGLSIDEYVGIWKMDIENYKGNEDQGLAAISKVDENTLAVKGLSLMEDFDDTVYLNYDSETGLLKFAAQMLENKYYDYYPVLIALYNSKDGAFASYAEETLVGGLNKAGVLKFLNNENNMGKYDSMIGLAIDPESGGAMYLSGYWNYLNWTLYSKSRSAETFVKASAVDGKEAKEGFVPRRTYNTELGLNFSPIQLKNTVNEASAVNFTWGR